MRLASVVLVAALVALPLTARAQDDTQEDAAWAAEPPPPVPEQPSAEPPPQVTPPSEAKPTLRDFQAALDPYGQWFQVPGLGLVWQPSPAVVGTEFTPYVTGGSWVSTPQGWAFQSQWNWGWAPYHYGRWLRLDRLGWAWWPDYTWAPSWVDWRTRGETVAWAPLPPPGYGVSFALGVPGWSYAPYVTFGRPWSSRHVFYPRWGVARGAWGERGGWGGTPSFRGARPGGNWHAATPYPAGPHPAAPHPGGGGHRGGGGGRGGGGHGGRR